MSSAAFPTHLPRLYAPELMDQAWFPASLRDPMADSLETVPVRQHLFDAALPVRERGLAAAPVQAHRAVRARQARGRWLKTARRTP